jgi:hypothetical protein
MLLACVLANEILFEMQLLVAVLLYGGRASWWMGRMMLIAQHLP